MSFHEITGIKPSVFVTAQQFPVFLFPDISGDCLSLLQLARQLQIARENESPIYIWHDPQPSGNESSLNSYAEQITEEIIKILPLGPCYLSGYSFGGILGSAVAQKLISLGRAVAFFVIDTPSIEASKSYLKESNLSATKDLVAIFKYAANLVSHYTAQSFAVPEHSEIELSALSQQSITEQLKSLQALYLTAASDYEKLKKMLQQYTDLIYQNLQRLIQHEMDVRFQPLSKIYLFCSDETKRKYSAFGFDMSKSWETYCHEGYEYELPSTTHLSLLNKKNCKKIAEKMADYFKNYFPTHDILTMLCKPWVTRHPEIDLHYLFNELERSKPASKNRLSLANPLVDFEKSSSFESSDKDESPLSSEPASPALEISSTSLHPSSSTAENRSNHKRSKPIPIPLSHASIQSRAFPDSPSSEQKINEQFLQDEIADIPIGLSSNLIPRGKKQPSPYLNRQIYINRPSATFFAINPPPSSDLPDRKNDYSTSPPKQFKSSSSEH